MRGVIYVKLDIVYSINHQLNETISRNFLFFETVKSKVIISLFKTVRLSVSISPRNLYNSLKSIKEYTLFTRVAKQLQNRSNNPTFRYYMLVHIYGIIATIASNEETISGGIMWLSFDISVQNIAVFCYDCYNIVFFFVHMPS